MSFFHAAGYDCSLVSWHIPTAVSEAKNTPAMESDLSMRTHGETKCEEGCRLFARGADPRFACVLKVLHFALIFHRLLSSSRPHFSSVTIHSLDPFHVDMADLIRNVKNAFSGGSSSDRTYQRTSQESDGGESLLNEEKQGDAESRFPLESRSRLRPWIKYTLMILGLIVYSFVLLAFFPRKLSDKECGAQTSLWCKWTSSH